MTAQIYIVAVMPRQQVTGNTLTYIIEAKSEAEAKIRVHATLPKTRKQDIIVAAQADLAEPLLLK